MVINCEYDYKNSIICTINEIFQSYHNRYNEYCFGCL